MVVERKHFAKKDRKTKQWQIYERERVTGREVSQINERERVLLKSRPAEEWVDAAALKFTITQAGDDGTKDKEGVKMP